MTGRPVLLTACMVALCACGGGSSDPGFDEKVATVSIQPAEAQMFVGETETLVATPRNSQGQPISGRTVMWNSLNTPIASVDVGKVTAHREGGATISATVDGVIGTASISAIHPTLLPLELLSGDEQRGLTGKSLADSLVLRVRSRPGGEPVSGMNVIWSASEGSLSQPVTSTDANGIARVQFKPDVGNAIALASVDGLAPLEFRSNGRASGQCVLAPAVATERFSLGPTDFTLSLRATNPLRIAVLFVDFSDAPATELTATLMSTIIQPGIAMLNELSHERVSITTVPFATWYRMPQTLASYSWSTFAGHRAYLLDVLSVTNPDIDFSTFDALYVFAPPHASKPISPTFNGGVTANVVADGRNFGNAVTFGNDSRAVRGPAIVAHETGHMFGLVDLYAFNTAGEPYAGEVHKYVGSWSPMGGLFNPTHFLVWEKRKLGFVDDTQIDCLEGTGGVEAILTPNHVTGGQKAVVVKLDEGSALVVEVRSRSAPNSGLDTNLCAEGVLVYEVDARVPSGQGPARIHSSRTTASGPLFDECGPWPDAVFDVVGPGAINTFLHPASGTTVTVLSAEPGGAYRVRVKR